MIIAIEIALLSIFGFFLAYLAMLSLLAMTARKQYTMKTSHFQRLAVVVPAHDEELAIRRTLRSLFAVDYPRESFDVIVVADNCKDRTADIARSLGAVVHERRNPTLQGKGYALKWCFDILLPGIPKYDAVVVLDADSVVSSNFLEVVNFHLERGAQAIQCRDKISSQLGSWSPEITRVGFTLYSYVRPLGRRVLRCSAGLCGTGMCFTTETLRRVPWQAYSLTEDLQYGLELLLHGITVVFAPEATALSPMPQKARNAESQRARWEVGRIPLIRKYAPLLLLATLKRRSLNAFIALIELVIPPLVNLLGLVVVLISLKLVLWGVGVKEAGQFIWLWLVLLALGATHLFVGLYAAGADRLTYRALLYIPRYGLWKLVLYGKLLRGRKTEEWIRTAREFSPMHQDATDKSGD